MWTGSGGRRLASLRALATEEQESLLFVFMDVQILTLKPSFVSGPNNPHIGLRPYLEKLKIRLETRYRGVLVV